MAAKRLPPTDPHEWINRAASNLDRSRLLVPNSYFEDNCFEAQQAAEKAIKAVFIRKGIRFPLTHDLTRLLTRLEEAGLKIPSTFGRRDD